MKLLSLLAVENIFCKFRADDKTDFFNRAVDELIHNNNRYDRDILLELFFKREKTLSTGIGNEVAIPHVSYDECTAPSLYLFCLEKPLDFKSLDNVPVKIVFMLLGTPLLPATVHLQVLAKLGLLLKKSSFLCELLQADSPAKMYEVIKKYD